MISIDEQRGIFLLSTESTSYAFALAAGAIPTHVHWGERLARVEDLAVPASHERPFSLMTPVRGGMVSLDSYLAEYPWSGSGDFRTPAWEAHDQEGYPILEAWYTESKVHRGKPPLDGLPASSADGETETLEVVLRDEPSGLEIHLLYSVFPGYDVITRSALFVNGGSQRVSLARAASLAVDFDYRGQHLLSLNGAWGRETQLSRHPLPVGSFSFGSRTGTTSHYANPFVAVADAATTEQLGTVRAAALVYSGNFRIEAGRTSGDRLRLLAGINPDTFSWLLEPGERFTTPEAILVHSESGLNGMSARFHRFIRERVMRSRFRSEPRPILVNNWEATYFGFTHDSLLPIVDTAADLGIELFVLDDGWFGTRNDDTTSLGDWSVNRTKLPQGLDGLAREVNKRGLRFGLWFEPEMVSPESELYREHPDWCLHLPDREKPLGRNQLVLDFSRHEVCEEIVRRVSAVLDSAPIGYVKWDMNRYLAHVASPALPPERRGETAHRYLLGLYRVMDELTTRHPEVLFAGCSGGGGRFDAGILTYMPQIWASDDSDAVERLRIQYGLSLVYPLSAIEAHVTTIPNHQVGRITPFATRGNASLSANFGFEINLAQLDEEDRTRAAEFIAFYKEHRALIQFGTFLRLASPFEGERSTTAWMVIDERRERAIVFAFEVLNTANREIQYLPLAELSPERRYAVEWVDNGEMRVMGIPVPRRGGSYESGEVVRLGADLMGRGLELPRTMGDFMSFRFLLTTKGE